MAPTVLLHGLLGSARWWDRHRVALERVTEAHPIDLFALARPFVVAEAADRLVEWLGAKALPRVNLVGHSMGGAVALDLASRFPERVERLVLVDAAVRPIPLPRRLRGALVAAWRVPPALVPLLAANALRSEPGALWRTTRQVLALDVSARVATVSAPTLVIWGERDPLVPVEIGRALAAALPRARLEVLPGVGHNPVWERTAQFNRLVLEFLAERDPLVGGSSGR